MNSELKVYRVRFTPKRYQRFMPVCDVFVDSDDKEIAELKAKAWFKANHEKYKYYRDGVILIELDILKG